MGSLTRLLGFLGMVVVTVLVCSTYQQPVTAAAPYALKGWETRASEWTALTTALYWEADLRESEAGLRAIAWVILNRKSSEDFPNTIRGVVTEGYRKPGCQFSFACNGAGESPREFRRLTAKRGVIISPREAEERWLRYSILAAQLLENPGIDPTGGANHYWASYINDPYWVKSDIVADSIVKIGSHKFGWSKVRGEDVPRLIALE